MNYKTLNLKDTMPTVELALAMIEIEIETCRKEGVQVLKIIHGYGSHGVGGEIKRALKKWLLIKKRGHFVKEYVFGEAWGTSKIAEKVKILCPEILGDSELYSYNPGLTVVIL